MMGVFLEIVGLPFFPNSGYFESHHIVGRDLQQFIKFVILKKSTVMADIEVFITFERVSQRTHLIYER